MTDQTVPADAVKMGLTLEQLAQLKSEVLLQAPYASRVSFGLVIRLVITGDMIPVLREIDALEGLKPATTVKSKRGEQFKHPPLFPLWHKHYFASRHVLANIGERWNLARGEGNRDLIAALSTIIEQHGHDPAAWPGALAHRIFVDGLTERASANRLTGDWLVFAKHCGQNYYLDLAQHEEADGPTHSAVLIEKLRSGSQADFPFLF
ncbi:hypothetical protein [Bradyrhizobium sp. SEMIA]|uniref:hypothetical protein n=1 Tax=Bradyrhizobium sp. SEMIA TaxID=2597515 RepID=UPI0018A4A203|nr:hypothetical protein [Bradyrhizobium sp. SEMIA]QOG21734.1 hypothetical protein FOM02_35010 [Bradyrhizobium sp. SEMIA]